MNTRNDTNDKLNVLIGEWLDGHRQYINRALSVCDSPIEQMLLMAFLVDRDPPQGIGLPMFERDVNDGPDPKHNLIDFRLCIEVDGHDFHERTKEQARADRSRDRDLAIAGWHVLRFTGSEVWRDPKGCVNQVHEFVTSCDLNAFAQRRPNDEDDP